MRRRPAVPSGLTLAALGLIALTAAVAVAAVALAAGTRSPSCAAGDRQPTMSHRTGADKMLVPAGARTLLLCRYSGTESRTVGFHRLLSTTYLTSARKVARLASELNALPPANGAYACPNDNGTAIIARFGYAKGGANPVRVGLSGCELVTNGKLNAIGDGKSVISQLANLVPLPATVTGIVRVCGGPAPGHCHVETYGSCTASAGCTTTDRVAAIDGRGRLVQAVRLKHARFTMLLPAGAYTLQLLADGPRTHGQVVETVKLKARSAYRIRVTFTINVP